VNGAGGEGHAGSGLKVDGLGGGWMVMADGGPAAASLVEQADGLEEVEAVGLVDE
jgi:hypothetical protein